MDCAASIIGIIGSASFAICSLPQVVKAVRTRSTKDISMCFLILSIIGTLFSAGYVIYTNVKFGIYQIPLYFNYAAGCSFILILFFPELTMLVMESFPLWIKPRSLFS